MIKHFSTKNTSFLNTYNYIKCNNIRYPGILTLLDKSLEFVNPRDPNLTNI